VVAVPIKRTEPYVKAGVSVSMGRVSAFIATMINLLAPVLSLCLGDMADRPHTRLLTYLAEDKRAYPVESPA
jgi:hypothetical protein